MSHQNYGLTEYWESRYWTLTLTGLKSSKVEIEFEELVLREYRGKCYDYLQITTLRQICTPQLHKITVDLPSTTSKSINFKLVTSSIVNEDGFWLQYKGMPMLQ